MEGHVEKVLFMLICVVLFPASGVAEAASERARGLEGTVKEAAEWHAGEAREEEEKGERGRRELGRGTGEREEKKTEGHS